MGDPFQLTKWLPQLSHIACIPIFNTQSSLALNQFEFSNFTLEVMISHDRQRNPACNPYQTGRMLDVNDKAYLYDSGRTHRYLSIEQLGGNKLKKTKDNLQMK